MEEFALGKLLARHLRIFQWNLIWKIEYLGQCRVNIVALVNFYI